MNTLIFHARQMSLALLVVAVVDHGHLQTDYSGSTPQSWGLLRLGRDIMRRAAENPRVESSMLSLATKINGVDVFEQFRC
jgi:hypothetical protein